MRPSFYRRGGILLLLRAVSPPIAAPALGWVKYEDPLEHAFTLDVPQGWSVKGGTFRPGYSDHHILNADVSPGPGWQQLRPTE